MNVIQLPARFSNTVFDFCDELCSFLIGKKDLIEKTRGNIKINSLYPVRGMAEKRERKRILKIDKFSQLIF